MIEKIFLPIAENPIKFLFLGSLILVAITYFYQVELPRRRITEAEIRRMDFSEIVEYLENTPIVERSGRLWSIAGEIALKQLSDDTDLVLRERYWAIVANSTPSAQLALRASRRFGVQPVSA